MKKIFKQTILILLVALSAASCIPTEEIEIYNITDIEIGEVEKDGMDFSFVADIENPNGVNLTAKEADIEVFFDGNIVGIAHLKKEITLPKNSRQDTKVYCTVELDKPLESHLDNLLFSMIKGKLEIHFKGEIRAKAIIFTRTVQVDEKHMVPFSEFNL